ncbi:hypothetical protein [Rubidibacter lacunae]|uniref:hypothetical protein n=1 Tax=Rubidibacter lacunae TaxID=582514 RepID=UPI0005908186|nr:hypothetical protein [Rubidibacter lacunae]
MPNSSRPNELSASVSGFGCWLVLALFVLLLSAAGLGWLAKGVLVVVGLMLLLPALLFAGIQFWLRRQFVRDRCPVCTTEIVAWRNGTNRCPNCGESVCIGSDNRFQHATPPDTVDVSAVEVEPRQLDEGF